MTIKHSLVRSLERVIADRGKEIERLLELLKRIRKEAENENSEIEFAHWVKAVIDREATEAGGK